MAKASMSTFGEFYGGEVKIVAMSSSLHQKFTGTEILIANST